MIKTIENVLVIFIILIKEPVFKRIYDNIIEGIMCTQDSIVTYN